MKYLIAIILVGFAFNVEAFWNDCPGVNVPGADYIRSPQCSHVTNRCSAARGEVVEADIYATPWGAHEELMVRATAFVLGIGIPLPIDPEFADGCTSLMKNGQPASCPTTPLDQYVLRVEMPIPGTFPTFNGARVRVEFFDRGNLAACGEIIADVI